MISIIRLIAFKLSVNFNIERMEKSHSITETPAIHLCFRVSRV